MAVTIRYRSGFKHSNSKRAISQTVKVINENGMSRVSVSRSIKQNKK